MAQPFRVGVMQLTMEPLDEILEHARAMDEGGFDTIWLAEAYPWWRKHSMEARSSTALSPLIARETKNLAVGWGIISPFTRHPVQVAMDARLVQEAAGPGRFILGYGTSKIFLNNAKMQTSFDLSDADGAGTLMKWAADVKIAGPVGSMGQRVLQPIVNQQVQHVLGALDLQVQEALAGKKD